MRILFLSIVFSIAVPSLGMASCANLRAGLGNEDLRRLHRLRHARVGVLYLPIKRWLAMERPPPVPAVSSERTFRSVAFIAATR